MEDLISFFNSSELELPGSWDTYLGSFEQFIGEMFSNYQTKLNAIAAVDYLSNRVRTESTVAATLCVALEKCLSEYLLGHPPKAYGVLSRALLTVRNCFKAMYTLTDVSPELTHLYRIRKDTRPALSQNELFHVPFELQHKVAACRYSIPGLPCLYLGGSAYVCWEECGQPVLDEVHLARFRAAPTIQLLDFGWRPAQMAAMLYSGNYRRQLSGSSPVSDLVVAHALCWPLLAICSIRVKHQGAPFKPEYIIPQLVLQWLTSETAIDGVRYFTTKTSQYFSDPVSVANFAFPVRTSQPRGFCSRLASKFELSNPVYWPLVSGTAPTFGTTPHTNFTLNTPPIQYNQTELGRLQHCAAALVYSRI